MKDFKHAVLFKKLKARKLQAFLVTKPANVHYLTGYDFRGEAAVLLYQKQVFVLTLHKYLHESLDHSLKLIFLKHKLALELKTLLGRVRKLGIEEHLNLAQLKQLRGFKHVPVPNFVEELRQVKRPDEIAKIRQAAKLSSRAFKMIAEKLKPGLTEKQIAWMMEKFVREHGADKLGFEVIVASGENSAKAHAKLTDRKLKVGDLVTIDFGACVAGYHSDMTRTFMLGQVSSEARKILQVVKTAQKAALAKIKAGVDVRVVDKAARDVIKKAGYAKYFNHATGHGLGLEIHEAPRISYKSRGILRAGMVLTVEPGIYLENCGARWEDTVLVTRCGYERLT